MGLLHSRYPCKGGKSGGHGLLSVLSGTSDGCWSFDDFSAVKKFF